MAPGQAGLPGGTRRELILVRHAESAPDFSRPAHLWHLSATGRRQARSLAGAPFWPRVDLLFTSDEPKALATAVPAARRHALRSVALAGLREVRRPAGRVPEYEGAVAAYLAGGTSAPEWEPLEAAERRIWKAVEQILRADAGATVALVSHGTVLTLLACRLLRLPDRHSFWKAIPFAGHARIDPEARVLLQGFGGAS